LRLAREIGGIIACGLNEVRERRIELADETSRWIGVVPQNRLAKLEFGGIKGVVTKTEFEANEISDGDKGDGEGMRFDANEGLGVVGIDDATMADERAERCRLAGRGGTSIAPDTSLDLSSEERVNDGKIAIVEEIVSLEGFFRGEECARTEGTTSKPLLERDLNAGLVGLSVETKHDTLPALPVGASAEREGFFGGFEKALPSRDRERLPEALMKGVLGVVDDEERLTKEANAVSAALVFGFNPFRGTVAIAVGPQIAVFKPREDEARLDGRSRTADSRRFEGGHKTRPFILKLERAEILKEGRVAVSPGEKKMPKLFDARGEAF